MQQNQQIKKVQISFQKVKEEEKEKHNKSIDIERCYKQRIRKRDFI